MTKSLAALVSAVSVAISVSSASAQVAPNLDQGWSAGERTRYYEASQGSRLMPLAWFSALEQPNATGLFADDTHMASFRYLPYRTSHGRTLPVGFAVDVRKDDKLSFTKLRWREGQSEKEPWVGMTCSACHTAELRYRGTALRIDGGPTLADFQGFIEALNAALVETHDDAAKFARFAGRVLAGADTAANRELLRGALAELIAFQKKNAELNAAPIRYGFARLDAFGRIYNKVSQVSAPDDPTPNPSNAPVSYPFIWNTPQHDKVQWNGIAENRVIQGTDIGALGRNTGEVIGVFADIRPTEHALAGYRSSVWVENLIALEQQIGKLRPPRWPSALLGAPNAAAAAEGKTLFASHCAGCHKPLARTDLTSPIVAQMSPLNAKLHPIGTDPSMACNAYSYSARSGVLEGTPAGYFTGEPLGEEAYLSDMLRVVVSGALFKKKGDVIRSGVRSYFGQERPPVISRGIVSRFFRVLTSRFGKSDVELRRERCLVDDSPLLAYKARPLTGIWATAPYLHNGSVPTLYDLLLPPESRPKSFHLGTREFDPINVGYVTTPSAENSFVFETLAPDGSVLPGNSNAGHDYGSAELNDSQRRALVEYLKTL